MILKKWNKRLRMTQYKKPYISPKQQLVIDLYDGDYKNTAKNAKVSHAYVRRLCTDKQYSHIQEAIKHRNQKETSKIGRLIATRKERQSFWTRVMQGRPEPDGKVPRMMDRLKASELLGKSEADFTENVKVEKVKPLVIFDDDE